MIDGNATEKKEYILIHMSNLPATTTTRVVKMIEEDTFRDQLFPLWVPEN